MILKRVLTSTFCTGTTQKHHHKITELVKRMTTAQETLKTQSIEIKEL